jgi:hypothetical protein
MPKKLSVTYHAPHGDSKVVEMMGFTFYDGKAEEITISEPLYKTISQNKYFECGKPSDVSAAEAEVDKTPPPPKDAVSHAKPAR